MDRLKKLAENWWRYCIPMTLLTVDQQENMPVTAYETSKLKKERWIARDEENIYFPFGKEMIQQRKLAREKSIKYEHAEKREERKRKKRLILQKEREARGESNVADENDGGWGSARVKRKEDKLAEELVKFSEKPKPRTGKKEL